MDETPTKAALLRGAMAASTDGNSEAALALLAQASAAFPQDGVPHFLRAAELASLGRYDAAEDAFSTAVLLAPQLPTARFQLGLLQFSSGRLAQGLLTWQPLLMLSDDDPLPSFVRGFAAVAEDDVDRALRHFVRGIELNRDNPALTADIRRVVARLESLCGSQCGNEDGGHVLLTHYQRAAMVAV